MKALGGKLGKLGYTPVDVSAGSFSKVLLHDLTHTDLGGQKEDVRNTIHGSCWPV